MSYALPDKAIHIIDVGRSLGADSEVDEPWEGGRHLQSFELWFIRQGSGRIRERDSIWKDVAAGYLVLFKPHRFYEVRQTLGNPLGVTYIRFEFESGMALSSITDLPLRISDSDPTLCEAASRRILELFWEAYIDAREEGREDPDKVPVAHFVNEPEWVRTDTFAPQIARIIAPSQPEDEAVAVVAESLLRTLLLEFIHRASRGIVETETGVKRFQHRMIANLAARIIADLGNVPPVASMAQECGYSLDHFGRVFRKVLGQSPQHFVMQQRISQAKKLLVESALSIKEIAATTGYKSPYFFSRQFKTLTGESPSEYRQRHTSAD